MVLAEAPILAKHGMRTVNQQKDRNVEMENEFYAKEQYFSYSAISKLLTSPIDFYKYYILKEREEKPDKYLLEGKLIHCFLLDEKSFDKDYIVMTGSLPSENTKFVIDQIFKHYQKDLLENPEVYEEGRLPTLDEFEPQILSILEGMNLHQSLTDDKKAPKDGKMKTGDEKRIDKICTTDATSYWDFRLLAQDKTVVDKTTRDFCLEAAMTIANVTEIRQILGMDVNENDDVEVFNEKYEKCKEDEEAEFGFHGFLDNLVIDHDNEVIRINDFKTTGKSLAEFHWTIENFKYWIQAVIYYRLIAMKYQKLLSNGYQVEIRFVVVDNNGLVYPFLVSNLTLAKWQLRFDEEIFPRLRYHYRRREYCLPYELAAHPKLL